MLAVSRGGDSFGQQWDDFAVNSLAEAFGEVSREVLRLFDQLFERAAVGKGLGGKEEPEIGGVRVSQQAGVNLDVGLCAAASSDADADLDRIETELRAMRDDDVGDVFAVGDGEGIGDR